MAYNRGVHGTIEIVAFEGRSVDGPAAAALAELESVIEDETIPGEPPTSVAELTERLHHAPFYEDHWCWVAWDDGRQRLLGAGQLIFQRKEDNQHLAYIELWVRPDARGAGLGAALLQPLAERAAAEGRTLLVGAATVGGPGAPVAEHLGAVATLVEDQNRLPTADVSPALLDGWIERAPERATGYSLVAFDERCPDDLIDRYVTVYDVMNGAPRSASVEDRISSPEWIRAREESNAANGTRVWTVVARHDGTGELVGFTELVFGLHRPWHAWQGNTGVDPAHRDKGLGRWLKAVNLRRLLAERPDVEVVDTWNADSNEAMLAINRQLGFARAVSWQEYEMATDDLQRRLAR